MTVSGLMLLRKRLLPLMIALTVGLTTLSSAAAPHETANEDTRETKTVAHLGVIVEALDDTLQAHLDLASGLILADVADDSPAEKAGLESHQILLSVDDQKIFNGEQLRDLIRSYQPGDTVDLIVLDKGQTKQLEATLSSVEIRPRKPAADEVVADVLTWRRDGDPSGPFQRPRIRQRLLDPLRNKITGPIFEFRNRIDDGGDGTWEWKGNVGKGDRFEDVVIERHPVAFLGVELEPVSDNLAGQLDIAANKAVLVNHVVDDSPAEKGGVQQHDIITAIDGDSFDGVQGFIEAIRSRKKGDAIRLTIIRGKKEREIKATLGERPMAFHEEMEGGFNGVIDLDLDLDLDFDHDGASDRIIIRKRKEKDQANESSKEIDTKDVEHGGDRFRPSHRIQVDKTEPFRLRLRNLKELPRIEVNEVKTEDGKNIMIHREKRVRQGADHGGGIDFKIDVDTTDPSGGESGAADWRNRTVILFDDDHHHVLIQDELGNRSAVVRAKRPATSATNGRRRPRH